MTTTRRPIKPARAAVKLPKPRVTKSMRSLRTGSSWAESSYFVALIPIHRRPSAKRLKALQALLTMTEAELIKGLEGAVVDHGCASRDLSFAEWNASRVLRALGLLDDGRGLAKKTS